MREAITAVFPEFDQNHGILRAIPETYDGHSLNLQVQGVTDDSGKPINYETSSESHNTLLKVGDADRFVHGEQTYVIKYTMRDVTKRLDQGTEFYWDANGSEWAQTFQAVTARVACPERAERSVERSDTVFHRSVRHD